MRKVMDEAMKRDDMLHQARRYACLLLGTAIVAFGLFNVHGQSGITEGGVLGATLLIQHWTGISPAVSEIVLDVICYALGFAFLGRRFLVDSLIATCAYAGFFALFEGRGYMLPDMGHVPVLAAVVGALFVGIGVGLIVRQEAAGCGDDALALVISNRTGWGVSRAYLITDMTVLTLSLSYIPVGKIACSLITVTLSSLIIGKIHTGGK